MPTSAGVAERASGLPKLAIGALGVVFGDIGTSPLYAMRDTFAGHHPLPLDQLHILGIVSLMFWSLMIIVSLKYLTVIMRADNKGEGGSLALLALINQQGAGRRWGKGVVLLGVFATALFYGDAMITPAVSVLGAIEGIAVYRPELHVAVVPLVVVILIALFLFQARGTEKVAAAARSCWSISSRSRCWGWPVWPRGRKCWRRLIRCARWRCSLLIPGAVFWRWVPPSWR